MNSHAPGRALALVVSECRFNANNRCQWQPFYAVQVRVRARERKGCECYAMKHAVSKAPRPRYLLRFHVDPRE